LANLKSAAKRARQAPKRQETNLRTKNTVRTIEKKVRAAITAKDKKSAETLLKEASSKIDKAATKGVFHRRTAARKISRLSAQVHALA
jgi:small subunit ribosomal protein S20